MWAVVRGAAVWLFGDDLVKYALYIVGALFLVVYAEATAATAAIEGQAFGQWWLAGVGGGANSSKTTVTTPAGVVAPGGGVVAPIPVPTLAPVPMLSTDRAAAVIANAMTWLGVPYLWGGCTHAGVDCSCFVQNAYRSVGVSIPRTTPAQIAWTQPITAAQAAAGDLVFFDNTCTGCGPNPTHVGLVLGGGQMIDAGDPVHIERIFTGHNARYGRVP